MFYMRDTFPGFPLSPLGIPVPWKMLSPKGMESKGICAMSAKREAAHQRKMKYYFFNYTEMMRLYNYHRNTFYLSNIEHKSLLLYLISEEPDPEEYPVVLIIHTENSNFQYWCRFTTENLYDIYDMIDTEEITPTFDGSLLSNTSYHITSVEIRDLNINC